jgi:hypothetical protein
LAILAEVFIASLALSRTMLGYNLQVGKNCLLPNPYVLTILGHILMSINTLTSVVKIAILNNLRSYHFMLPRLAMLVLLTCGNMLSFPYAPL